MNRLSKGPSHEGKSGVLEVSFLTEKIGAAVNHGNYFYYTEDGGRTWRETRLDTDPCLGIPCMVDAKTIAVGGLWDSVRISTDAGLTWTSTDLKGYSKVSMVDSRTGFFAMNFAIRGIGPVAGEPKVIPKPEGIGKIVALSGFSAAGLAVMDAAGALAVSGDAGKTWRIGSPIALAGRTLALGENFTALQFINASRGIAVCFDSAAQEWLALSTEDGGSVWKTESLLKSGFGYCSVSRDMKFVTIVPTSGDYKIIVLKNTGT